MKNLIALAALVASTQSFAFIDDTNTNHNGSAESKATVDAEGRGVANFTMSFSGSATTKGNMDADGMMQNIFGSETTPYYYR